MKAEVGEAATKLQQEGISFLLSVKSANELVSPTKAAQIIPPHCACIPAYKRRSGGSEVERGRTCKTRSRPTDGGALMGVERRNL